MDTGHQAQIAWEGPMLAALVTSCAAFVGSHFLLSHPLRRPLVRRLGENAFRGLYSLIALVTFGAMILFYRQLGREPSLWDAGPVTWVIATILMWIASVLFVGSFFRNPALLGAAGPKGAPSGVVAITRHPMLWSFAIWALVHGLLIGTPKAIVLDGAILILALGGAAAQDVKKTRDDPDAWHSWVAQSAFVPFTRGIKNPGWVALAGGTAFFVLATWLHPIPVGIWRWLA